LGYCDNGFNAITPKYQNIQYQNIKLENMSKTVDFKKSIQALNDQDLQARIKEDELRLKKLEFAHAISPLENPMSIRSLRRELARLKTELKKKQLGA
jgi:large subunit ribosomal protein L29